MKPRDPDQGFFSFRQPSSQVVEFASEEQKEEQKVPSIVEEQKIPFVEEQK